MTETSDDRARLQQDVFLEVVMKCFNRLQLLVAAIGAALRGRHRHNVVDARRLGALPGRMPQRSATSFALRRRAVGSGRSGRGLASLELTPVQRLELSPKLLVFQFHLLGVPALVAQLLVKFFQLIFVLAFGAVSLLVAMKDPARGEPFQIRAAILIRAPEVVGQILKLRACLKSEIFD
jgi:hypothetical protein